MIDYLELFTLGLSGNIHCLGMCGPLILAIPGRTGRLKAHLLYHLGRVLTYTLIGVMLAFISSLIIGVVPRSIVVGYDPVQVIKIGLDLFAGAALSLFGLMKIGLLAEPAWIASASPLSHPGFKRLLGRQMGKNDMAGVFFSGIALGFLPCGLSYAAFARAISSTGPLDGGILVFSFALGTIPGLLLLGTGFGLLARRYQMQAELVSGVLMLYMGLKLFLKVIT
jgi:uncharacterized protein